MSWPNFIYPNSKLRFNKFTHELNFLSTITALKRLLLFWITCNISIPKFSRMFVLDSLRRSHRLSTSLILRVVLWKPNHEPPTIHHARHVSITYSIAPAFTLVGRRRWHELNCYNRRVITNPNSLLYFHHVHEHLYDFVHLKALAGKSFTFVNRLVPSFRSGWALACTVKTIYHWRLLHHFFSPVLVRFINLA